ncbi:ATP phosphoribosyltransferase [Thermohalobacter berrensis]|uniref:ATP phosphoribosyltransferase n=1 Tax=Thermohalobacter berrensis TaxID=99594 RepID=A0A419T653_9FIRM|nr:ATP phosphoribosyltransferase [Thermohalobacter berrensis]RKD32922.1 ATP phosphoribosyltransferase [Thermohalobacter berrensis]
MEYLNIALAKGRLAQKGYKLFKEMGFECEEIEKNTRKLIFVNEEKLIRYILVKASDVPAYVERGAADLGVVGKDTIMEEEKEFYELCDLGFGKCKFVIAGPPGYEMNTSYETLRVATKYPNVAKKYFLKKGKQIDLIKLNGSVELAPLVGLADVIVDIVETGRTLKENGLKVIEDMYHISARLIANKVSFKMKNNRIKEIMKKVRLIQEVNKRNDKDN